MRRLRYLFPPMHTEGQLFLLVFAIVSVLLAIASSLLGFIGIALTVWVYAAFRNPLRIATERAGAIVSPTDGIVEEISIADGPEALGLNGKKFRKIVAYLSPLDCHVQRIPLTGSLNTVIVPEAAPFDPKSLLKSDPKSKTSYVMLTTAQGVIAIETKVGGPLSHISNPLTQGFEASTGTPAGITRFAAEVRIYLPENIPIAIGNGQRLVAGETVLNVTS